MDTRRKRAREIQLEIAKILWEDWDPVGMQDVPEASDEYDGYVGRVYRLLVSNPDPLQVAEYLYRIEVDWMGLGGVAGGPGHLLPVAKKLLAIDIGLDDV